MSRELVVTVYTKPDCAACDQTKRHLTKRAIPFTEVSLDEDTVQEAVEYLGFKTAPIVVTSGGGLGEQMWAAYRPDRIDALIGSSR